MDWATISPKDAGLNPAKLEAWRSSLAAHRTTGLLVIRRGRIALEWYAPEWNANRPHGTASMAKAVVPLHRFAEKFGPPDAAHMDRIIRGLVDQFLHDTNGTDKKKEPVPVHVRASRLET